MSWQRSETSNVPKWLLNREIGERERLVFKQIPSRSRFRVEDLLDDDEAVLGCVLLGFTSNGDFLISYTSQSVKASDGKAGFHLQLWSFQPGRRLCRSACVPLFRDTQSETFVRQYGGDSDFTLENFLVTVAESPDGSLLVVHGRSDLSEPGAEEHEACNYVTVLTWAGTGGSSLQVHHFSYQTLPPHQMFDPAISLLCPGTLVINTSTAVVAYCFERGGEAELRPVGPPRALLEAEPLVHRALQSVLRDGWRVSDYQLELLASASGVCGCLEPRSPRATGPHPVVLQLVASAALAGQGGEGVHRLFGLVVLADARLRRPPLLLRRHEIGWVRKSRGVSASAALRAVSARYAVALGERLGPLRPPAPLNILSNRAALESQRSADEIRHPVIPVSILGYGRAAAPGLPGPPCQGGGASAEPRSLGLPAL